MDHRWELRRDDVSSAGCSGHGRLPRRIARRVPLPCAEEGDVAPKGLSGGHRRWLFWAPDLGIHPLDMDLSGRTSAKRPVAAPRLRARWRTISRASRRNRDPEFILSV